MEEAVMSRGVFAVLAQGNLNLCTKKSEDYTYTNILPSVGELCLSHMSWLLEQDNDPKHASIVILEWMRRKHGTFFKIDSKYFCQLYISISEKYLFFSFLSERVPRILAKSVIVTFSTFIISSLISGY